MEIPPASGSPESGPHCSPYAEGKAKHAQACTIIKGGVLEASLGDLHRIHLNAISRQRPAVPSRSFRRPFPHQRCSLMSMKNLLNRCSEQAKIMVPQ
jgi:hypothetical protein